MFILFSQNRLYLVYRIELFSCGYRIISIFSWEMTDEYTVLTQFQSQSPKKREKKWGLNWNFVVNWGGNTFVENWAKFLLKKQSKKEQANLIHKLSFKHRSKVVLGFSGWEGLNSSRHNTKKGDCAPSFNSSQLDYA